MSQFVLPEADPLDATEEEGEMGTMLHHTLVVWACALAFKARREEAP